MRSAALLTTAVVILSGCLFAFLNYGGGAPLHASRPGTAAGNAVDDFGQSPSNSAQRGLRQFEPRHTMASSPSPISSRSAESRALPAKLSRGVPVSAVSSSVALTADQVAQRARGDTVIVRASGDKASPHCYYEVHNFCVRNSALLFLRSPSSSPPSSVTSNSSASGRRGRSDETASPSTLRLCNELRRKFNLPVAWQAGASQSPPGAVRFEPDGVAAHILGCWQFYGFHAWQCAVAAFDVEQRPPLFAPASQFFAVPNATEAVTAAQRTFVYDLWLYNHAVSMPKAAREHFSHAMFLGGPSSWTDTAAPKQPASPSSAGAARSAPWWGVWSANAARGPATVRELQRHPEARRGGASTESVCYRRGLIGQPVHHVVSAATRREHVRAMRRAFGIAEARHLSGGTGDVRVIVAQRGAGSKQGSRRIVNVDDVVRAAREALGAGLAAGTPANRSSSGGRRPAVHVDVVDFAALPFDEQMRLASRARVLIATHGAGNVWAAFMPEGASALIELWPQDAVSRDVYATLCRQHGVGYAPVFARQAPLFGPRGSHEAKFSFLHQDVNVPLDELRRVLRDEVAAVVFR